MALPERLQVVWVYRLLSFKLDVELGFYSLFAHDLIRE